MKRHSERKFKRKQLENNTLAKKYFFTVLSVLNRKIYAYAFLKLISFKRVAIALHYYAKDINRIPIKKKQNEEIKEILVQNQSYSQGIISSLCKNKSYQNLPTTTNSNHINSSMSTNSSRKKFN